MDIIANNIANINTTGFKGEKMMFKQHLVQSKGGDSILGEKIAFVRDIASVRDTTEGPHQKTGNPLDLAIAGDGYFVVDTPGGNRYTRNGSFQLNNDGNLVNQNGYPVLSDGGQPFFISPEDNSINISRDGTISTNSGDLGRIGLVNFENKQELRQVAGGLFASNATPEDAEKRTIVQGMLESSNVEGIIEMTRMIEVNRAYAGVKQMIQKEDERIKRMAKETMEPI